jgi:hypothetical protein
MIPRCERAQTSKDSGDPAIDRTALCFRLPDFPEHGRPLSAKRGSSPLLIDWEKEPGCYRRRVRLDSTQSIGYVPDLKRDLWIRNQGYIAAPLSNGRGALYASSTQRHGIPGHWWKPWTKKVGDISKKLETPPSSEALIIRVPGSSPSGPMLLKKNDLTAVVHPRHPLTIGVSSVSRTVGFAAEHDAGSILAASEASQAGSPER